MGTCASRRRRSADRCCSFPAPSYAWGFEAHKFIAEQMIALAAGRAAAALRAAARPTSSSARSIPICGATWDGRPRTPHHFLDLDYFGEYPFAELPREYDRAVQKFGRERRSTSRDCCRGGRRSSTGELQRAFEGLEARSRRRRYAQDNIVLFSAILAHYVGDGHVPLHSVVNYDGQRPISTASTVAGNRAVRAQSRTADDCARTAEAGDRSARVHVRRAARQQPTGRWRARGRRKAVDGPRVLRRWLLRGVREGSVGRDASSRLNDAITAVASIIIGAWEQAGRRGSARARRATPRPVTRPRG